MSSPPAQLIQADGTVTDLIPQNGRTFVFQGEAYDLLDTTMIQIAATHDGRILLVDEDGKRTRKPVNLTATKLYRYGDFDSIVGTAIVCDLDQVE
jgi:phosphatidylserine decarboxylase